MTRIYAIGDIHGCLDALEAMLERIEAHRSGRGPSRLLFIGDYVDRGPSSRQVVERVIETGGIALLGNHEEMMLAALGGSERWTRSWLANGGVATMQSYGCADIESFRKQFPDGHRRFVESLPLSFETEDGFFAHAGIDPSVPLSRQSRETLLWIREPFLDHRGPFEKRVIHGHTPALRLEVLPWRVNLDTGCGKGGTLSCAVIEGREVVDVLHGDKRTLGRFA